MDIQSNFHIDGMAVMNLCEAQAELIAHELFTAR
jgi:hypothetical protein